MTTTIKKRVKTLDVAKGIGILLVMLTHNYTSWEFHNFIYLFVIPLFFFIAGSVFVADRPNTILNKFVSIIIPWFIFAGLTLATVALASHYDLINFTWLDELQQLVLGGSMMNNALWYLPTFFIAMVVFYMTTQASYFFDQRTLHDEAFISIVSIIFSVIGFAMAAKDGLLPFHFHAALMAQLFLASGYLGRFVWRHKHHWNRLTVILGCILLTVFGAYASVAMTTGSGGEMISDLNFGGGRIPSYWMYNVGALGLIAVILELSDNIKQGVVGSTLAMLGRNTMWLFPTHLLIYFLINIALSSLELDWIPSEDFSLLENLGLGLGYVIVSTVLIFGIKTMSGRRTRVEYDTL